MIVAFSDTETIFAMSIAFLLILALIVLARLTLRKIPPTYTRWRFGVFVERDGEPQDDELPP